MADSINKVNIDLNNIYNWCRENGLRINPEKTVAMCIGTRQIYSKINLEDYNITLNNVVINWSDSTRSLGVILDYYLSFKKYLNKIISMSFMKLKMVYRLKKSLSPDTKLKLIQSLIYPNLDYCFSVYDFLTQQNKPRLQKVQNACMRFVFDVSNTHHVTPFINNFKKLKMHNRFIYCIFL